MLEQLLGDNFTPIQKIYEEAAKHGMTKAQVKEEKRRIGAKTLEVAKDDERLWLWYMPERIWEKYHD